jgi:hypothetical protein
MDLEEIEVRNDCAGEGQQLFNRPTDRPSDPGARRELTADVGDWQLEARCVQSGS